LKEIFGGGVTKTIGKKTKTTDSETDETQPDLKAVGHVELALYTGEFTRDDTAGVDFLVVGDVNRNALKKYVSELEKQEGKSIRYAAMTLSDFEYRRQIKDRFVNGIERAKKQILVDEHNLLG
jgi:hypothetical protein